MKRFISLVLCFMLVFTMFQPAFAEDSIITWTGNAGDGLWHTADNWTPERVPGSGDTAVIPESQTVTVTADTTATLDCSGEVLVEAGAHLTLTGTSYLRDGMLGGDGNITITGNGSKLHWSNGDIEGEGTFTIDPDIQLVIETDYIEDFGSYVSAVIELPLVNNGQIMVNRGYLYLVGGSEGSGTFTISDGAYLVFEEGDYNIGGNFVNEGYVYIWDASVHFGAGYRQESTGRTVLDFFGAEPGNYCKLDVGGLAELDGILEITTWEYVPGDFPSPGDTFEIMTYASRTGQFSEIISDPVKLDFDPTYGDTSLTLLTLKEDNTPPHLTSTIPAHGATMPDDADIDSLTLVFDEPVWGFSSDTEENLLSIYEAGTDHLVFERELSPYDKRGEISGNGQDTITISIPSRTFQLGKSYYIFIDEGAFVDVVGNEFAGISDSSAWNFTVQGDTQPPTVPANLHSTSNTSSAVTLQWDPASDDHGPISYQIYGKKAGDEEFVLISTTTDTTYTVIQLDGTLPEYISPETAYTFVVYAMDGGGNVSAQSNEVTVTTNQSPNLNWVKRSIETFIPSGGFPFEWIFYYDTCYGAGKYVAVGTYGTILTSAGIESPWEFEYGADSFDPSLKAITYGSDMFVAVGGNSVYTKTSTGEWNKVYSGYGSVVLEDVACGKKKDGSGDIFVAVGENMIWWSENGIDWQPCLSKPYTSTDFVFCGVAADEEGNFVAVGYKEIPYSGNNTPLIWKSGNGKNWSLALDSGGNGQLTGLAYGSGAFVAGGGSVPEALISTDKGNGWGKSSVLSGGLTKIAYGDGLFVATGGTKIYISDNGGYTWTRSGQEFENMLVSVNYCNESFVLTDTEGNIFQTVEGGGGPIPTSPSEPQDFTATPGDGQVALSWREPDSNGGSAITHYEVSSDNGSTWVTVSTGTSHTFTGLTNGIEYTFKVRAVNAIGPGAQASATATPIAPPAPTYTVTVTNGTGGGEYTEGATVTITANSAPDGQRFKQWQVISGGITLANPTEAITSFLMPANAVEVVATYEAIPTVPTAPQNFTATPGYGQVALSWTAPENNGSAAISHYEVSSDNGITWVMVSTGTSHTFTDLTNGTEYTFKVRAVNSAGPGAQASVTATPIAPPVPTYTVIVTNGTGSGEYSQGTTVVITANPASDGQQFKEWQVISGGITLENPKASGTSFEMPANYVEVVAIYEEIPVITYTVTINGSYAATTGAGSYAQGETVTIHAGSRTNYSFNGWSSSEDVTFANLNSPTTTFIMPARNVNITANWTYIDSEGSGNGGESGGNGGEDGEESGESDGEDSGDDPSGSSGDSTPSTPGTSEPPAYNADVKTGKDTEMVVPVTVDKDAGIASVTMDSDSLAQGGVNITIPSIPDIDAYSVNIPVQDLSAIDAEDTVSFHTETGSITIPSNMLADISVPDGDMAQIMIGQGDKSNLPDDIRDTIGDRPLVQLTLSIDSKQTDWNNPDAPVTVSIPYTPTAEELENPESIVVWYIDGSGNVVSVPNGRYDPETGTVTFTTTHFSYYAVGFKPVSFKDVPKDAWYAKAVSFIAAREITLGTGGGNFSPEAKLTRGQFIVMMMRAYGIAPDENPKDNFKDAGNTWYTGYLAAAKRLGISAGVGDNLFAPENAITRQEMFTLLYNGLKVIGKLPRGNSGKTLSDFSDAGDIAPWAMDAMKLLVETGMVSGSGNKLSPKDTTTRAQMAQVFYNLLSK